MTRVVLTQDLEDIGRAIDQALRHIDVEPLVRDKIVAVKPNETWATKDDTSAVTQGDTLRARQAHAAARRRSAASRSAAARKAARTKGAR